ncbi:MAG: hypothetical protein K9M02_21255 [Thiohalocapsa sp.]|nr:hypothetical protein [Thiohalocapsa sp.]
MPPRQNQNPGTDADQPNTPQSPINPPDNATPCAHPKDFTQGFAEGIEHGIRLGQAKVLRRQLALRFGHIPAWAHQRLEDAAASDLDAWTDRVLDRQQLEEILEQQG